MLSITDRDAVKAALTDPALDSDIRALLGLRAWQLDDDRSRPLAELVKLVVVQPGPRRRPLTWTETKWLQHLGAVAYVVRHLLEGLPMRLYLRAIVTTLLAVTTIAGCAADASPEEDTGDVGASEDALLAGRLYTPAEVAALVRAAGFPESVVGQMVCTAKHESSFFERATNKNKNGSMDRGLFQINSIHLGEAGCASSGEGIFDAAANARCARAIYRSQGIRAWYGYRSHKAECDRFEAP